MADSHRSLAVCDIDRMWSSPDEALLAELSAGWYQTILQDSLELQTNLARHYPQSLPRGRVSPHATDQESVCQSLTAAPSHISSHSASLSNSTSPVRRVRKYRINNSIVQRCQQTLQQTAHPSPSLITTMAKDLQPVLALPEKKIKSMIREWFRKRREYLATKIYRSCDRLLPKMPESAEQPAFLHALQKNTMLIGLIAVESRLPIEVEDERIAFVQEKIADYYLTYPKRRLRNSLDTQRPSNPNDADDFEATK